MRRRERNMVEVVGSENFLCERMTDARGPGVNSGAILLIPSLHRLTPLVTRKAAVVLLLCCRAMEPSVAAHNGSTKDRHRRRLKGNSLWTYFLIVAVIIGAIIFQATLLRLTHGTNNITSGREALLNEFAASARNATKTRQSDIDIKGSTPRDSLVDRSVKVEIPDNDRKLAFVHIGKSGGSTISILLRNGCMNAVDGEPCEEKRWEKVKGPAGQVETIASQRIEFYLHTPHAERGMLKEYYDRITSVVMVVRDPLERFISAFLCRHPKNIDAMRARNRRVRLQAEMRGEEAPAWAKPIWGHSDVETNEIHRASFTGCYPNVNEFAFCADERPLRTVIYNTTISWTKKKGSHQRDISLDCVQLCRDIATGTTDNIHHVRWNYQSFLNDLSPEKEVFAIRTTHLWNDWVTVNNILGSTEDVSVPEKGTEEDTVNARRSLPVRNNLTPEGREILCQLLREEIRVYVSMLNRAVNLSNDDVQSSLDGVKNNCPLVYESLSLASSKH
jgi:hypothetical protein